MDFIYLKPVQFGCLTFDSSLSQNFFAADVYESLFIATK